MYLHRSCTMCRTTAMNTSTKKCCKAPRRVKALKTTSNAKTRKTVRFSDSNKVNVRQTAKEELKQTWYQMEEYESFKKDRTGTIIALRRARGDLSALDPNEQCIRGLEMQATPEIFRYRANGIKSTVRGVLKQQEVQRLMGLKDGSTLGAVSELYSKAARNLATALAEIDARSH